MEYIVTAILTFFMGTAAGAVIAAGYIQHLRDRKEYNEDRKL